jgi:hypothetical protein
MCVYSRGSSESGVASGQAKGAVGQHVIYTQHACRARARGSKKNSAERRTKTQLPSTSIVDVSACLDLSSTLQLTAVSGSCGPRTAKTSSTWLGRAFR